MTVIRSKPGELKTLALKSEVVISTNRGQLIASSWPRKRGKPTNPVTIEQNEWLTWSARALPYAASVEWEGATAAAKGTGLYPRDILTLAASGKLYDVVTPEGQVLTRTEDRLEMLVFNGAILKLTANIAIGSAGFTYPAWPVPVRDTFGFWDAGAPDRLTIPVGVDVIELFWGGRINGGANFSYVSICENAIGGIEGLVEKQKTGFQSFAESTGPILVAPGDFFRAGHLASAATTLQADGSTFFKLNVLESS